MLLIKSKSCRLISWEVNIQLRMTIIIVARKVNCSSFSSHKVKYYIGLTHLNLLLGLLCKHGVAWKIILINPSLISTSIFFSSNYLIGSLPTWNIECSCLMDFNRMLFEIKPQSIFFVCVHMVTWPVKDVFHFLKKK